MSIGAQGTNIKAISEAIDQHNTNCDFPAAQVKMNHFEHERLGWDSVKGVPIVVDAGIATGRFVIVCGADLVDEDEEITEAVSEDREVEVLV